VKNCVILLIICGLLSSCEEGKKGTVKIIHQDERITIYQISKGAGNGYVYVTDKGFVEDTKNQDSTHAIMPPHLLRGVK
jgi:hypothetical protein